MQHLLTAQLGLARTMFGLLNLNKYLAILILAYLGLSHAVNAQEGIVYLRAATRENRSSGFPTRSDTNRPVQAQKRARSLKFRIYVEEELYYPSSENKGADQLRSHREADLRLCFRIGNNPVFSRCGSYSIFKFSYHLTPYIIIQTLWFKREGELLK